MGGPFASKAKAVATHRVTVACQLGRTAPRSSARAAIVSQARSTASVRANFPRFITSRHEPRIIAASWAVARPTRNLAPSQTLATVVAVATTLGRRSANSLTPKSAYDPAISQNVSGTLRCGCE